MAAAHLERSEGGWKWSLRKLRSTSIRRRDTAPVLDPTHRPKISRTVPQCHRERSDPDLLLIPTHWNHGFARLQSLFVSHHEFEPLYTTALVRPIGLGDGALGSLRSARNQQPVPLAHQNRFRGLRKDLRCLPGGRSWANHGSVN